VCVVCVFGVCVWCVCGVCVWCAWCVCLSRDSSVGTATRYRMDGPRIESRWRRVFPHPSRPGLRPTQPPVQWTPLLSRWIKWPGAWHRPPTPCSAEVKERVQLNLYASSGSSWPVIGWHLLFPTLYIYMCMYVCTPFTIRQSTPVRKNEAFGY